MKVTHAGLALVLPLLIGLTACGGPEIVEGSNWQGPVATPSGAEFTPQRAMRRRVEGWAAVQCANGPDRRPTNCFVLGEWPMGMDFGAAALKLAPNTTTETNYYRADPRVPIGGAIILPVMFCQPAGSNCPALRQQRDTFAERAVDAEAAAGKGDCAQARAVAADQAQPGLARFIAARCGAN
jgi:hypothetical protein